MEDKTEQPIAPYVSVPFNNRDQALYSQMNIKDLMLLRGYLDDLIGWIAAGNPVYLGSFNVMITEKKKE